MFTSKCFCWLWAPSAARPGCPGRSRSRAPVLLPRPRCQPAETAMVMVMAIATAVPSRTWPRPPRSDRRLGPDAGAPHRVAGPAVDVLPWLSSTDYDDTSAGSLFGVDNHALYTGAA